MSKIKKYRAWEPDNREMVYFDLEKASCDPMIACQLCALLADAHHKGKGLLDEFTGLKDKNGVEVYEGDIVKQYGQGEMPKPAFVNNVVGFDNGSFTHCLDRREYGIEVIGNIHANPELLEA